MRKKALKKWFISAVLVMVFIAAAFFVYLSFYYPADEDSVAAIAMEDGIEVRDNIPILSPSASTDTALIFYPGAKVESRAYLPILDNIRDRGIVCILVDMPFRMAFFDVDAAEDIFPDFPEIEHWYIGGHSLGGSMASAFASDHEEDLDGLILLGAYVYGDYPTQKALTIYGSLNTSVEEKVDYSDNVVVIEGGNHAQFGNYAPQRGDAEALISAEEQQEIAADAIEEFINQ